MVDKLKSTKETSFAPSERKNREEIVLESEQLKNDCPGLSILDMIPDLVTILNPERQIIYANQGALDVLQLEDDSSIIGLRPGEMLGCIHSQNNCGGCGTAESCRVCGAVKSIITTFRTRKSDLRECEITTLSGSLFNLRVWSAPFDVKDRKYILFVGRDIGSEKHLEALEHTFSNDLNNLCLGLFSLLHIIDGDAESYRQNQSLLKGIVEEMMREINFQRDIIKAENGSLPVTWKTVSNLDLVRFVIENLRKNSESSLKNIVLTSDSHEVKFKTDLDILKIVLLNTVKNALESSESGENVLLYTYQKDDKVIFRVHNRSFIPKDVQLQLFNRSFSTKSRGRGFGAYSIKLLSKKYLHGKVHFTSSEEEGTSFFLEYPIEPPIEIK